VNRIDRLARLSHARVLVAERLRAKRVKRRPAMPPPRYDEIYYAGLEWLDDLSFSATEYEATL